MKNLNVIIVGSGEVGYYLAQRLSMEEHNIVIIDKDEEKVKRIERTLNVLAINGSGTSKKTLLEAGIKESDLFIAVTDRDETNLIACLIASEFKVPQKVARIREPDFPTTGIDMVINPTKVLAEEIVRLAKISEAAEWAEFMEGKIVLLGYQIKENCPVAGKNLKELGKLREKFEFLVVAIAKDGEIIIPSGDDQISEGDRIFIITKKENIYALEHNLGFKTQVLNKVFIIGGGQVGEFVAKKMEESDIEVFLIEKDQKRCEELAEKLNNVVVLNMDGLETQELLKEGIDNADLVIGVTDTDTVNILSTLLAKHHGAKKCIIRIDRPDFIPILNPLGIDVALSPRLLAANEILKFVRRGKVRCVATFLESQAEVMEFVVPDTEPFNKGKRLRELSFPKGAIVGAISRDGEVIIPHGDTILMPGDDVVVFAKQNVFSEIEKLFML